MAHYTTDTYTLKREILTFSNKISRKLSKPDRKFTADMAYGMLPAAASSQISLTSSTKIPKRSILWNVSPDI